MGRCMGKCNLVANTVGIPCCRCFGWGDSSTESKSRSDRFFGTRGVHEVAGVVRLRGLPKLHKSRILANPATILGARLSVAGFAEIEMLSLQS